MKKLLSVLLLGLPLLFGCAGVEEEPAVGGDSQAIVSWSTVLTCDNGAAVLDVDAGERRNLQFVIRDQRIVGYFASEVRVSTRGIVERSGEIILRGRQDSGVWNSSDFRSLNGGVDNASVSVRREGQGVKVVFYQSMEWSLCAGGEEPSPSTGMCPGETVRGTTYNELANWYFRDCR